MRFEREAVLCDPTTTLVHSVWMCWDDEHHREYGNFESLQLSVLGMGRYGTLKVFLEESGEKDMLTLDGGCVAMTDISNVTDEGMCIQLGVNEASFQRDEVTDEVLVVHDGRVIARLRM